MADLNKTATALPLNHITHSVPFKLEVETSQYTTWAELFKTHCRAHDVLDHLFHESPTAAAADSKNKEQAVAVTQEQWNRTDAIILTWMYATISRDLLETTMQIDTTAKQAWDRLRGVFTDNRHSRALALEHQFTNIKLERFSSISSYCQEVKNLADQINNVSDEKISDKRMVLQLVAGLPDSYDVIGSRIAHSDPFPKFYAARSMLILEESRKTRQSGTAAATETALSVTTKDNRDPSQPTDRTVFYSQTSRGRGGRSGGRSNRSGNRGRGRNSGYYSGSTYSGPRPTWPTSPSTWTWPQQWAAYPPCPYPTAPWTRPNTPAPTGSPGILGPRPQQAYHASVMSSTPTDIDQALHTMTLNPPEDTWYMDTGASSHMVGSQGLQDTDSTNAV